MRPSIFPLGGRYRHAADYESLNKSLARPDDTARWLQGYNAAILLACDQPFVNAAILRQLIQLHLEDGKPIVASAYAGTLGIPALFDRSCFADLLQLTGDSGAKKIILARRPNVAIFDFQTAAIDIDTAADYEKLRDGEDRT